MVFLGDDALLQFDLAGKLQVVPTLFGNHIETSHVFVAEVQTWLWHVNVNHFVENFQVSRCVFHDALYKPMVSICTEEVLDVVNLDFEESDLLVGHLLE